MIVEDEQLAAFAPGLDRQFRARCVEALAAPGAWPRERVERALDVALERARELGLSQEHALLAYLLLAAEVAARRPEEHVARAMEAILREPALGEYERVHLAADYLRQMHEPKE